MDAFHFLKSHWKSIFNIAGGIGVMRQFHVIVEPVFIRRHTQAEVPLHALLLPEFSQSRWGAGFIKKLLFNCSKFPHREMNRAGKISMRKAFPHLCNAE